MRQSRRLAITLCCVLSTACAIPGPKLVESVAPIAAGVESAKQQSDLAFVKTNEAARNLDASRVLEENPPNLKEADFPLAIRLEDRRQWANAFTVLGSYTRDLQNLVDPSRAATTKANLRNLGAELNSGVAGANVPAAAVNAFSEFASVLVQLRAERTATEIMRKTDESFIHVMQGMADAIGADNRHGLRGSTHGYYEIGLSDLRVAYSDPSTRRDPAKRKALIGQFIKTIDDREAQLANLGTLNDSLMALGQAHHAAAYGNQGDALFWIQRINTWLDEATKDSGQKARGAK